jgi:hypothetical protein
MMMKKLALLCLPLLLAVSAKAQVSGGISITDDGVRSFYLAVGQNYHVPQREVVIIHERRIPDDEIPVVFFLAQRAHVKPGVIVEMRLAGQSWMDITLHYHLRPDIFYLALNGDPGPEYGRAYGHWRQPRKQWKNIRFDDDDIVKMVNLRFVSSHYRIKPDEVVRLRGQHGSFVKVSHEVSNPDYKSNRARELKQDKDRGHDNGNGKDKGNGNGNGNGQKNDHH